MHISIWQQFASNHSSYFTVVGEFRTEEEALRAYQGWCDLVISTQEWLKNQYQAGVHLFKNPSPPEVTFAQQHNMDWYETPITWIGESNQIDEVVQKLGRRVLINTVHETASVPYIIEKAMSTFGATVSKDWLNHLELLVTIGCTAIDEKSAEKFFVEQSKWCEFIEHNGARLVFKVNLGGQTGNLLSAFLKHLQEQGFADIVISAFEQKWYSRRVTFLAPSVESAQKLYQEIQDAVTESRQLPWRIGVDFLYPPEPQAKVQIERTRLTIDIFSAFNQETWVIKQYLEKKHYCTDVNITNLDELDWKDSFANPRNM